MGITEATLAALDVKFTAMLPHLDERQRRLYLASEADALGHGGIATVARLAEVSESTIARGRGELADGTPVRGRVRRPGGGRRPAAERDPGLVPALEALIEPREVGDPVSPLHWTTASLRDLARELTEAGHPVSATAVGKLLRSMGFSLQGMAKTRAGSQVPDRDAQFRHINATVERFLAQGLPVVSVDAKKKEPIGDFARAGRTYRPKGAPITASDHDFVDPDTPIAIPYGVYDLGPGRRLGERGHRPQHRGLCGGVHPPLVEPARPARLPRRHPAIDHRRLRRSELRRLPPVQERPGRFR